MSNRRGQKFGIQRGDRRRFPYEPRVIGGKLLMPAELQAIHRYVVKTPALEAGPFGLNSYRSFRQSVDMALKLRPTGLGSGIDKDRADYSGEWEVGRIYETHGGPDSLRWFWSLTVNGPMTRSDRVATLEEAKAQFQKNWDAWKAWAKLEEVTGES